jgi:hypothetical protein
MSSNEEISHRLEKLEDMFNQHLQEGATRNSLIQTLSGAVDRLEHTVYGNGKEGLVTIQARMDERLSNIERDVASMQECLTGLPEYVKNAINDAVTKSSISKKGEKKEEKKTDDSWFKWFADRVSPTLVTAIIFFVAQAVWEYIKFLLRNP